MNEKRRFGNEMNEILGIDSSEASYQDFDGDLEVDD
jgi:hypothetical protein